MLYKVITFYKYISLKDPEKLREELREICTQLHLKGRILLGKEGINAGISGTKKDIKIFKQYLKQHPLFTDLTFREQPAGNHTYHKLVVRTRKEITVLGKNPNLKHRGKHITPTKLKQLLDKKEDLILLDARNDYETVIGKFKNALTLPIKTFKEFPKATKNLNHLKNKKIVMYCTGGIRCEKSSAFLKEQGFQDVCQLQGGIINFINQYPDTYFEGSCFVFDDRLVVPGNKKEPISHCALCKTKSDNYSNCYNLACDKLFISCSSCQKALNNNCSEVCKQALRQRTKEQIHQVA